MGSSPGELQHNYLRTCISIQAERAGYSRLIDREYQIVSITDRGTPYTIACRNTNSQVEGLRRLDGEDLADLLEVLDQGLEIPELSREPLIVFAQKLSDHFISKTKRLEEAPTFKLNLIEISRDGKVFSRRD
ncbi:hypothetical protein J4216_06210 [Candidatus Woesearchaeota archaeon]|nr:hypothetical protein [Candidatus Woesearchaeota archaeon]